jgi:hypothetical protein
MDKSDSGGILRMRHNNLTFKQVQKVVGVGYGCIRLPSSQTLNRSQIPCRTKNLLEQISFLLSSQNRESCGAENFGGS